ncbi:MAG: hypothetical protein K0S07_1564, partial [Chlamydiales bacterium]|nr:hypothetical protein [Chlamydiales bacterium]
MDRPFNQYGAVFHLNDQAHLLQVKVAADVKKNRLKETVLAILNQEMSQDKNLPKEIALSCIAGKVFYSLDGQNLIECPEGEPVKAGALQIVKLTEKTFAKRKRSQMYGDFKSSLLSHKAAHVPAISLIWTYLLVPMTAALKALFGNRPLNLSSLKHFEDVKGRFALEHALSEVADLLQDDAEGGLIAANFSEALLFASRWRENRKPSLIDEMVATLNQRIGEADNPSSPLLSFPAGMWKDTFEPSFFSFYLNGEGNLTLSEMSYSETDGAKTRHFNCAGIEAENLKRLIASLLTLADPPQKEEESDLSNPLSYIVQQDMMRGSLASEPLLEFLQDTPEGPVSTLEGFKEKLFSAVGAVALPKPESGTSFIRKHPMKIVQAAIQEQFLDVPLQNKALFSLQLIYGRLNAVLDALPQMNREEKELHLHRLQQDYQSLERQFAKSGIGQEELESAFSTLQSNMQKLQRALQELEGEELMARLNKAPSTPYRLRVEAPKESCEGLENRKNQGLSKADYETILILKDAFLRVKNGEGDAIETLNGALKQANERIDSLIEGGQNALAELLSRQLLQLIPMPDDAENLEQVEEPSFWDTLAQTDAIRSRSDQIQAFSDQIALANHHFWEAKAKGGLERLKIDEPIHLLNSSAALLQTMQLRARLLSQLEEEDLTFEEEGFLAVAAAYRHLSTLTAINLLKNDYLRPLENASLALKYDRCLRYFRQFDKEQYSDAIHERLYYQKVLAFRRDRYNDYVELNCCGALLQVADKRGLSQDDRPMWQREALLWERLLDRHSQEAIAMPSQIAHIVRQEYIMFSLIYHESAIALPAHSLLEHLKGIRQLKQASGNEEKRSNLAQGNFAAVQKRLKQLGRLEIANQASFKATDLPDVIEPSKAIPSPQPPAKEIAKGPFRTGVLPRGAKANRPLDLEITREEAAGLQRGLMNPDEYQKRGSDLLGHPNEEVFGKKVSSWRSNFSGESEMTHLQQALTSNHPSPLDLFFLKSLDGGEQMNVQEVFNLLLQRPSLLGFKMENALGETALEGQKRFYEVLFQLDRKGDTFLIRALKKSPEYFLSHEKALRHLLEQHLHEEKEESFFLLFLLLSVHAQAKKAELAWPIENVERQKGEPLVQRQALKTVVDTWPSLESEYLKQALALLQKKGDLKTLVDASASITSLLAQQIDFANPEELPLELSTLAGLLRMGSILEQAQQEASLPILAMQGLIWVKEQLVPYIAQLEEEEKEEIFNLWAGLEGIETSDSHWHESADALSWQKGDAIVDLSALRVFQKGQPEKGILTSLPLEIVNHPNYRSAYGREKFLAHSTASKQPGTYLYTFKKGSLTHRITYNHFSKEITIERALLTESKKAQWERFSSFLLPKETESASWFSRLAHSWTGKSVIRPLLHRQKKENADALFSAEKMLSEAGVWLQPGGKEGTSNLRLGNQELRLLFDSGKVSSVLTADGLQVVFDGQRELASTLSCLPDSQMLFLKKPGAKWVQEIRFLGHALSLKRSCATDPWVLFGDSQLEGDWQWVQQRQRNDFAKEMLQGLGSIEKTGFTLQQGERISLFLWPQDGEEIQKSPPLKVYLEEGQVRASAAGYLHLAYLSAQEKEYKKALSYLKNAQKTKLSHSSELQAIAQIHTLFEQMPATSVRSTSCKIKGLLAARRILKEQGYHYQEANWSSFLSAEELKKTFALYQECLQTSSFKKKGDFIDSEAEVALTLDEIEQLKSLAKEAFSDLVAEKSALPPPNLDLHLKAVSQLEIQQALPLLLAKAKVPKDKTALRTFKLDDSIVEHFFERYQQILEKKLKPQDLLPLFAPLPEGSKQQRALLDIARRMLLSAASLPDQEADVFIDLKEIRKLHSSLPKNSYSLFFSLKYDLLKAMIRKKAGDSFLEASRALLNKLERAIGAGSRTGAEGPLEITPSGFQASKRESDPSPADGLLNQLQKNRYLSVEKIASFLQEEKVFLGPIRQMRLLEALASETFQRLTEETAGVIPLEKVVSFFEAECQFNLLSIMREKEVQERIELLEEELKEVISPVHHPLFFIEKALASPLEGKLLSAGSKLWQRAESLQETLDDLQSDLSKHLSPGPLLEGIQEAEKALSQRKRFSLKREDLAALVQAIDEEMAYSKMRLSSNQKILFHYLRNAELPENVQRALKQVPEIGNEEVLKLLKEEYQKGSLDQTTNQLLTIHLLEKTAYTILSIEVQRQLQELKALQAEGALESSDAWIHSVSKVKNLVSKALSFDRYFQNNSDGQWQLKNESLYR